MEEPPVLNHPLAVHHIELPAELLPGIPEPAALLEAVPEMEADASLVQGGDAGQNRAKPHLLCSFDKVVENRLAGTLAGIAVAQKNRHLAGRIEGRHGAVRTEHAEPDCRPALASGNGRWVAVRQIQEHARHFDRQRAQRIGREAVLGILVENIEYFRAIIGTQGFEYDMHEWWR